MYPGVQPVWLSVMRVAAGSGRSGPAKADSGINLRLGSAQAGIKYSGCKPSVPADLEKRITRLHKLDLAEGIQYTYGSRVNREYRKY